MGGKFTALNNFKSILIRLPELSSNFYQHSHLAAKQEKHGQRNTAAEFSLQSISFMFAGFLYMP
jgi:hypothetical protein